jgi:hypothetical protein
MQVLVMGRRRAAARLGATVEKSMAASGGGLQRLGVGNKAPGIFDGGKKWQWVVVPSNLGKDKEEEGVGE